MPRLLQLYQAGKLPIDRLISRRYPLDRVNEAYDGLIAGEVARSDPGLIGALRPLYRTLMALLRGVLDRDGRELLDHLLIFGE
jgi:hypothetical protein